MFRTIRTWLGRVAHAPRPARPFGRHLESLEDRAVPATIGYAGGTYANNFDWLPAAGSTPLAGSGPYFLDAAPLGFGTAQGNNTAPGWQFVRTGGTAGFAKFISDDGGIDPAAAYSYGTGAATDRAFGQLASLTLVNTLGATFTNTGSATYTAFTLSFAVEHWRRGTTAAPFDVHPFGYAVGTAAAPTPDIATGRFTADARGDLVTVNTTAVNTRLDGNAAANRAARTVAVTGIVWAPGQNLTVRWADANTFLNDDGLAVDDLTFSAAGGGSSVEFAAPAVTVAEGAGSVALTVTRTGGSAGAVTVEYDTTAGTATAGADYTGVSPASPRTLTIPDGATSATILIPIADDATAAEPDETFTVTLRSAGGGATPGTPTTATVTIADPALRVVGTPAVSGGSVVLAFNRRVDPVAVNLYDAPGGAVDPADLVFLDGNDVPVPPATVRGSVVFDPTADTATFVNTAGVLPTGRYKVRLRSGADGFQAPDGRPLDGDFTSPAFDVPNSAAPVMSVRGFGRGAGQAVNLPVVLRGAANVTQVSFTLTYDPALLTIPAAGALTLSADAGAAGLVLGTYTITPIDARHAVLAVSAAGGSGWTPAAGEPLLTVAGAVPDDAPYAAAEVLDLAAVRVNDADADAADGVHAAAYAGDATGDRVYTSLDAALLAQVGGGAGTGFGAYGTLDPAVIGDVTGDGVIAGPDAALVAQKGGGAAVPELPDIPIRASAPPAGPGPRLYFRNASAGPGQTVTVQLRLEVTDAAGFRLSALDEAVRFDPAVFAVTNVRTGSFFGQAATVTTVAATVDHLNGVLRVGQFTGTGGGLPLAYGADADVLLFDVTVRAAAAVGTTTPLNLLNSADGNGSRTTTAASDTGGALVLAPAPTDGGTDSQVDGVLAVVGPAGRLFLGAASATAGGTFTVPLLFRSGSVPFELTAVDAAVGFDPGVLRATADVAGGSGVPGFTTRTLTRDNARGLIRFRVSATAPQALDPDQQVELAVLTFQALPTAAGTAVVNLRAAGTGGGGTTATAVVRAGGPIDLVPAPDDAAGDGLDARVTVTLRPNRPPTVRVRDVANAPPPRILFNPAAAPGLQTPTPSTFAFAGTANAVRVTDPDAGATGTVSVTVSLAGAGGSPGPVGVLTATAASSAAVTDNGTTTVAVRGTLADVNATLASLVYRPGAGYFGRTTVTVTANDGGNTGFGGPLTDTRTTAVEVVGLFVSEVMLGPGAAAQYVEVYSTAPSYDIPAGVYLVGVEGDNGGDPANNPGLIQDIFTLGPTDSGAAAQPGFRTGRNGYLALLQKGHPYGAGARDPGGAVRANEGTGAAAAVGFGNGGTTSVYQTGTGRTRNAVHVGQAAGTGARDGAPVDELLTDIERASASYLLIRTETAPTTATDIDAGTGVGADDGIPDGADYAGWTVLDGVGLLDATNEANPDRAYGPVTFKPSTGTGTAPAGATVVGTDAGGSPWTPTYAGRVGRSVGSAAGDWLASVPTGAGGGFKLSPTRSTAFGGQGLTHLGGPNFYAPGAEVAVHDGGSDQRSRVSFLTVRFSQPVDITGPDAFNLRTPAGAALGITVVDATTGTPLAANATGVREVRILLNPGGPNTVGFVHPDPFGYAVGLADGNYFLDIPAARVTSNGVRLDGDGDGAAGGDLSTQVYRLFGDVNGDRAVDGVDNARFRAAYTGVPIGPNDPFDFDVNQDGVLDDTDLAAFRTNRGKTLPPG